MDSWDASDPTGYRSEAEAQARVADLLANHQRYLRRPMYPPAVITYGEPPRWKPRVKEKKHRFSLAELNGHSYRREALPEQEVRR
jgi:hypothetical protein